MVCEQGEQREIPLLVLTDSLPGAVDISVWSAASLAGLEFASNKVLWF